MSAGPRRVVALLAVCALLAAALAALARQPLMAFYRISGNSMRPSYTDGDRVLVLSLGSVEIGDTVIARHAGDTLIKRVVAGPGDAVEMYGGVLFVNGRVADDPVPPAWRDGACEPRRLLAGDEYFVLGDNRRVSVDSRSFGPVHRDEIVGRVVYRWLTAEEGVPVTAATRR